MSSDTKADTAKKEKPAGEAETTEPPATPEPDKKPEGESTDDTDQEIEEMKKKLKELEERAKLDGDGDGEAKGAGGKPASGPDVDARSIYVGSVDYATKPEELQELFAAAGVVNRVTIICDKMTGQPKGFAYVEFKEADSVMNAVLLDSTEFKGRNIKVNPKRTNVPGMNRGRGRGGRGGRGRGGFPPAGGFYGYPPPYGYPFPPPPFGFGRGRGGGFKNKAKTFAPY